MSTTVLTPGAVFANRYRVEACIAQGGMGAVYRVTHTETSRSHALKVMHPHILASEELRERFRKEARVAANVQSEHIVDVLDAGVDAASDMPYLVMELLQGEELGRLLEKRGRFSPEEVVMYLGQVAIALDKTHRAMIVHRDLKPENLFLTFRDDGSPRIKVLDFGIAKVVAETNTNVAATRSVGTPLYMAPEQFKGGQRVSPAVDLYALGLIAYTLLTGKSYWTEECDASDNVFAFAQTAQGGPVEPPCTRARRAGVHLPPGFDGWFAVATNVDPTRRYPSATAMIRALAVALGPNAGVVAGSNPAGMLGVSGATPAYTPPPIAPTMQSPVLAPRNNTTPLQPVPPQAAYTGAGVTANYPPNGVAPRSKAPLILGGVGVAVACALVAFFALRPSEANPQKDLGADVAPTASATIEPTVIPSAAPSADPTSAPTAEPSASATATPTASASVEPTGNKTTKPAPKPSGKTGRPSSSSVYIRD
ncbi:MAG: protein kinase [Polyangiaceae bacterium]|nr:protein kinase [Polyangiaceae bacterium]